MILKRKQFLNLNMVSHGCGDNQWGELLLRKNRRLEIDELLKNNKKVLMWVIKT